MGPRDRPLASSARMPAKIDQWFERGRRYWATRRNPSVRCTHSRGRSADAGTRVGARVRPDTPGSSVGGARGREEVTTESHIRPGNPRNSEGLFQHPARRCPTGDRDESIKRRPDRDAQAVGLTGPRRRQDECLADWNRDSSPVAPSRRPHRSAAPRWSPADIRH